MVGLMERENPIITSMMFADTAYLILNKVSRVLTCAIATGVCVVSLVALYVARSFLPIYALPSIVTIPLGIVVFVVLVPVTVYYGLTAKRMLEAWVQKFASFSFVVRFETGRPRGNTPQERLVNQIFESIPEIGAPLREYLNENPEALNDFLNVKIHDGEGEKIIDVCVSNEKVKLQGRTADILRKALRKEGIVLAKHFGGKDPVDEKELAEIRPLVLRTVGAARVKRMLIVATSRFTESAKNYAADKRNWVRGKSFDLIEKRPRGYIVASAIT